MKARIDGKRYDTETALRVYAWDNEKGRNDLYFESFGVYLRKRGGYFVHGEGGAATAWGVEDKSGWRAFGEGIFPIPDYVPAMIKRALSCGTVRFVHGVEPVSSCFEDPIGNCVVFIGTASRFAPAAENSGGRIG